MYFSVFSPKQVKYPSNYSSFFLFKIFPDCFLNNSQNFLVQPLPLNKSCIFSILLNNGFVDIVKPNGICSLAFIVDDRVGLF